MCWPMFNRIMSSVVSVECVPGQALKLLARLWPEFVTGLEFENQRLFFSRSTEPLEIRAVQLRLPPEACGNCSNRLEPLPRTERSERRMNQPPLLLMSLFLAAQTCVKDRRKCTMVLPRRGTHHWKRMSRAVRKEEPS